ncbi:hypothetical protein L208DRAFT_1394706 [Tricholoma matsutake]|nr:hypothetical protein L208DRAFT_1394706 [Tricholoma matsutake 945]
MLCAFERSDVLLVVVLLLWVVIFVKTLPAGTHLFSSRLASRPLGYSTRMSPSLQIADLELIQHKRWMVDELCTVLLILLFHFESQGDQADEEFILIWR